MKISDEAVKVATEQLNINDMTLYDSHKKRQEAMVRRILTAALPYLQDGFKVKRLEWEGLNDSTEFTARSIFGEYSVFIKRKSAYACSLDGVTYERINFNPPYTLDGAKAAAQADFERRVQECIDDSVDVAALEAKHDKEMTEVIKERDQAEAWADNLAYAIGGEGIGEHSSINNPWDNALEIAETRKPVDVAEVRNMVEKLIKAADEVVLHFGDNDSGFSIPSVNEADYICTSLGNYHEARAKLVSLIGDLSAAPTKEERQ